MQPLDKYESSHPNTVTPITAPYKNAKYHFTCAKSNLMSISKIGINDIHIKTNFE
jgi:hypothetical protein